ncbi:MAG: STAS domain-containing protein [Phycisphaerae bacterium]|nr:STAS domain-containing protein [Phycisphaerae bacterium]
MAGRSIVITTEQDVTVAALRVGSILDGKIIEDIGKSLYELVDEKAVRKLVVDFRTVSFLSSSMIGVLVSLHKKAVEIDGEVILCGLKPNLKKVFEITGLHKLLNFADDEKEALRQINRM